MIHESMINDKTKYQINYQTTGEFNMTEMLNNK